MAWNELAENEVLKKSDMLDLPDLAYVTDEVNKEELKICRWYSWTLDLKKIYIPICYIESPIGSEYTTRSAASGTVDIYRGGSQSYVESDKLFFRFIKGYKHVKFFCMSFCYEMKYCHFGGFGYGTINGKIFSYMALIPYSDAQVTVSFRYKSIDNGATESPLYPCYEEGTPNAKNFIYSPHEWSINDVSNEYTNVFNKELSLV